MQSYYDENALRLVKALVTGGNTSEIGQVLTDGEGLPGGRTSAGDEHSQRARLRKIYLMEDDLLAEMTVRLLKHLRQCFKN